MHRLIFSAVVIVVIAVAGPANAIEIKNRLSPSPLGGVVVPMGDFADSDPSDGLAPGATPGFCLGGAIEYGLTENLIVGSRISFNRFGYDEDAVSEEVPDDFGIDANWTIVEIVGAYLKLLMSPGKETRPYVRGGVFAGKPKATIDATSEGESAELEVKMATSLGVEAGIGVTHMLSDRVAGFFEGSVAHLMTDGKDADFILDGEEVLDGEAGYNIQWIAVRGGVTIYLGR